MNTMTKVPDLDPEKIFDEVSTLADLARALAVCGGQHERKLTFVELMREQGEMKIRLAEEFGPGSEREFAGFASVHPALAQRADVCNLAFNPAFAVAAVRAMRSVK